jgi:PAS domain S-box-containing protein
MLDTLADSFASSGFMPHGHCFLWTPSLLWTYVLSDSIIAASYFSIPFALWYIVRQRRDLPFPSMFLLFGAFVLACGATHIFEVWNIWHADYWADAGLKALTAIVSFATAILLWATMPKILTIPSHAQLENANRELQSQIQRRERAETDLHRAHDVLEHRVAERTAELEMTNKSLRESEARYRALTQSARVAIVTANRAGDIVGWNHGAETIFGYTEAEASGQALTLLMPNSYQERHLAGMGRVIAGGEPHIIGTTAELTGLRRDGSEFPLELSLATWETSEGQFFTGVIHDITERKRMDESLRESEEGLRAIFEGVLDGIMVADVGTRTILTANAAACGMLGYTRDEIVRIGVSDIHPKEDLPRVTKQFEKQLHGDIRTAVETPMIRRDGSVFYADIKAAPIRLGGKDCLLGVFRDITERKQTELAIARQRDLYNVLSQTNQAIVRGASRDELFHSICRIAVEHGRFRFAWIGLIGADGRSVEVVARHGEDSGYLRETRYSRDESIPGGRGTVGQALRTGQRDYTNNIFGEARHAAWHEAARRAGICALASLPIHLGGAVIGAMTMYAREPGFFSEDLLATLDEMALDVSFALDNIERERQRLHIERSLAESEEKFRGLVEQSIAGIAIVDEGRFNYINPRLAEIYGYTLEELIGQPMSMVLAAEDQARVAEYVRQRIAGDERSIQYTATARRKDGSLITIGVHGTRAIIEGRPMIIGLVQDISEKKRAEEAIQRYVEQLKSALMSTVDVATTLSEMRDPYTAGHERRVAEIAVAIGAELGLNERQQEGLRVAGHLHDIGKITIPSEILSKPGRLSAIEFQLVQGHAQASFDVLKNVEFPWPVAQVALQHHERMDGSGYPQGLKGEAILLESRVMAVADVMEAMSSHRPYRAGLGIEKALAEIERGRGTAYDADAADACLRLFRNRGYQMPA